MQEVGHSYLDELNEIQRKAVVQTDGPIMVIAGPGSGKTRVLTYKIAHLINIGIAPWQILALTFTNKAAKEMKARIEKVVGPSARRVWAGTFHSLFARILRVEAHRIGYPNDFTIYDSDDSKSLINELIKSMDLDKKVYNAGAIRARISASKSNLITPKAYVQNEDMLNYDKMNRRPLTFKIYEKYVARCKRSGAMDFDDLLLQMFRLLYENPDGVKDKYQKQFSHVLVDEFQDTNFLQYEILKQFVNYEGSPHNVCIVGDDAQSIYSFRGATIENILQFETDYPNLSTFKLEQNYRSSQHIVDAANGVIGYNRRQIEKKIWTDKPGQDKIKIVKTISDNEEGRRVADMIIEQKHRHSLKNTDIAILYRTNAQSRVFEEFLRRQNILYRIYGGLSFYQRKEIKDLLAYLRLTLNPNDDEALKRIVNYPKRGIGATTVNKLLRIADDNQVSIWQSIPHVQLSKRATSLLAEFVAMIATFRKIMDEGKNAYDLAVTISKRAGLVSALKADNTMEGLGRLENLNALLDGMKDFVENDEVLDEENPLDKSLSAYLQSIALITDMDQDKEETDVVSLMSTHACKGLEFKSVFVVGMEENLFPSYMSLSSPDQIEEERRLFYVAITRAEEFLTITYSNSRYQHGQMRFNDPSRFLEELPPETVDSVVPLKQKQEFGQPKILGNFKPTGLKRLNKVKVDPQNFHPDDSSKIKAGMRVMHLKFGEGKVIDIDERFVATIAFDQVTVNPEKRIMLQYAKLQILE